MLEPLLLFNRVPSAPHLPPFTQGRLRATFAVTLASEQSPSLLCKRIELPLPCPTRAFAALGFIAPGMLPTRRPKARRAPEPVHRTPASMSSARPRLLRFSQYKQARTRRDDVATADNLTATPLPTAQAPPMSPSPKGKTAKAKASTVEANDLADAVGEEDPQQAIAANDALRLKRVETAIGTLAREVRVPMTENVPFALRLLEVLCDGGAQNASSFISENEHALDDLPSHVRDALKLAAVTGIAPVQMQSVVTRLGSSEKELAGLKKLAETAHALLKEQSMEAGVNNQMHSTAIASLENTAVQSQAAIRRLENVASLFRTQTEHLDSMLDAKLDTQTRMLQRNPLFRDTPVAAHQEQSSEASDEEGQLGEPSGLAAQPSKVSLANAKWMPKPQPFSGEEQDVDETLFIFETYFTCTGQPESVWPQLVLTLLKDRALSTWLAFAVPHKNARKPLTWFDFRTCMQQAFAPPDKEFSARMQLRHVQQKDRSVKDYVRHVRSLIAQLSTMPPSEYDCIVNLFDGLNSNMKQEGRIDPRTGKFWTNFNEFAAHLVTLETHMTKGKPAAPQGSSFSRLKGVQKFKPPMARIAVASQGKGPSTKPHGTKPAFKMGGGIGPGNQHQAHQHQAKRQKHDNRQGKPAQAPRQHTVTLSEEQFAALQQMKK